MHVISRRPLRKFWAQHPDSEQPLEIWYRSLQRASYENWSELRQAFPSADKVGKRIVFNIGGNKYRLIAVIHFNRGKVYVRHVLTHREYNEGKWRHD